MEHKLINTGDYLLIVNDSEIKEGDWYLRYNKSVMKCTKIKLSFNEVLNKEETIILSKGCGDPYERSKKNIKKIIAHLPLNNSPRLENVGLLPDLPLLEDDIYDTNIQVVGSDKVTTIKDFLKKHNKEVREYTEEDIRKAFIKGVSVTGEGYNAEYPANDGSSVEEFFGFRADEYIKSLQQPKIPVGFECEIQHYYHTIYYHDVSFVQCTKEQYDSIKKEIPSCPLKKEIKTITNSQGLTQWVGEYSFDDKN
jgi:hypothetical protein